VRTFWREKIRAVGPFLRSMEAANAPATSSGSAGRITSRLGIILKADVASTGW